MAKKDKFKRKSFGTSNFEEDSKFEDDVSEEDVVEDSIEVESATGVYSVIVDSHTHAGVEYHSGDSIIVEHPATVKKLKDRGIIS